MFKTIPIHKFGLERRAIGAFLCSLILVFAACGCMGDWLPDNGMEGELGYGWFFYECVDEKYDPACLDMEETDEYPEFPEVIAVGSVFDVKYRKDYGNSSVAVRAGSPNHLETIDDALESLKAGYAVVVALSAMDKAFDLIHVLAQPVAGVCVLDYSFSEFIPLETIELSQGGMVELRGLPKDEKDRRLAGLLTYEWTIENPEVADLEGDTTHSVVTLKGIQQGHTALTVEIAGIVLKLDVEVTAGDAGVDGGPEIDAGPDAAVEPDGGFDQF
jgi:hypothetical protein